MAFSICRIDGSGNRGVEVPLWKIVIIIVLTLLFAELSWRFIEVPVRQGQWKIWFYKFKTHEWSWNWKEWALPYRIGSSLVGCIIIIFVMGMIIPPPQSETGSEALEQHLKDEQKKLNEAKTATPHNEEKKITASSNKVENESSNTKDHANTTSDKEKKVAAEAAQLKTKRINIKPMTVPTSISVTAIGDSVMLSAATALKKQIPQIIVDAKVGRQVYETSTIVEKLKSEGKLGKVVVLGLGSNGDFSQTQLKELLKKIGNDHHIYLVNTRVPRNWQENVNRKIKNAVKQHPNVKLIDWYAVTEGQYDLFYDDHIHPNQAGGAYYTALISSKIAQGEK